ncbi:unnamed protein product [Trypanosoma congolense IL3000]|uniref:WGS project CAEQ00000000 data, annotated contig 2038 n=1 Tax=Trypanosoma congolense (strain IL3000) TaxID=1068625 RepID=F9WAZ2_TRYCI|nr:unnamed protein product [Trypanosoma congolense IL3000]
MWEGHKDSAPNNGTGNSAVNDSESDFCESECSASYVSSASSSSYNPESSHRNACSPGQPHKENETCQHPDAGSRLSKSAICDHGRRLAVFPIHGTALSLREPFVSGVGRLEFLEAIKRGDIDFQACRRPVVLGYNEHGTVFLLPEAAVEPSTSPPSYRCPAPLCLSLSELGIFYSWEDAGTLGDAFDDIRLWELPLASGCMTCPEFKQPYVKEVFDVSTDWLYYFEEWSAFVQFMGTAWGLLWVRKLPASGSTGDAHSCVMPLMDCSDKQSLREVYKLRNLQIHGQHNLAKVDEALKPPGVVDGVTTERWAKTLLLLEEVLRDIRVLDAATCGDGRAILPLGAEASTRKDEKSGGNVGAFSSTPSDCPPPKASEAQHGKGEDLLNFTPFFSDRKEQTENRGSYETISGETLETKAATHEFRSEEQMSCAGEGFSEEGFMNYSPFFVRFLKAVAYWKLHIHTPEEQSRQKLAFVGYYSTNAHQRLVDAVSLLQRHKAKFSCAYQCPGRSLACDCTHCSNVVSVEQIVRILLESEVVV